MTSIKKHLEGCTAVGYQDWLGIPCRGSTELLKEIIFSLCKNIDLTTALHVPETGLLQHLMFYKTQTGALVKPFQNRKF